MSQITTPHSNLVKEIKNLLSHAGVLSKQPKIQKLNGVYCIYSSALPSATVQLLQKYPSVQIQPYNFEPAPCHTPLPDLIQNFLKECHVTVTPAMAATIPRKWSVYPPMVLFNASSFEGPEWEHVLGSHVGQQLLQEMLRFPEFRRCTHLAINKPIVEHDVMRRPFNIMPLIGDFGPDPTPELFSKPSDVDMQAAFFCHVTQNGLHQTWAPMYTMFSRGNIKEKKRLLDKYPGLQGTVAVDLYAGIGYFSFSYLRNGATLFAWEINPWSVEGLRRGLAQNGFRYKVFGAGEAFSPELYGTLRRSGIQAFIFHESNEHAGTRLGPISQQLKVRHVNLGLLPSSQASWPMVQEILRGNKCQSTVHVHENVHIEQFDAAKDSVEAFFGGHVVHLEKVKTFAPDVWHIVMDIEVDAEKY